MPIYEFYCNQCHTIYNFYSKTVNTEKVPLCPACQSDTLSRQVSVFSVTGRARENDGMNDLPFDESKMEQAVNLLATEGDHIDEDDPRQAAQLMRKLSDLTGMKLGNGMEEALSRMEKGEDPDEIESQMGDILESEDPFDLSGKNQKTTLARPAPPKTDDKLYDL